MSLEQACESRSPWSHVHPTVTAEPGHSAPRADDLRLLEIAQYLTPDLRVRLLDLSSADSRAVTIDQLEHRVKRAQDLIDECRRHLAVRERQVDQLREQLTTSEGEREDLDTAVGTLLGENVELEASLDRVRAVLTRWDTLSKGESETTRAIRAAIAGDGS